MFNYEGPMLWMASLIHDPGTSSADVLTAVDGVVARLQQEPVEQAALDRAIVKWRSAFYDMQTELNGFGRSDLLASFALFDDDPARINRLETELRKVTPELVQRTAREYLRTTNRTVLTIEPGAAAAAPTK
jgi:predicted Zn-dependent peptidase